MTTKQILSLLKERQKRAFDDRDFEEFNFLTDLESRIRSAAIVGKAIAGLYKNTSDDNAWNAMYEALSDAGLLDEEEDEES